MPITTVTSKGQVTIPMSIRKSMGIGPGDKIEIFEDEKGVHVRKQQSESPFDKYVGLLKHLKGRRSDDIVEEMRGR